MGKILIINGPNLNMLGVREQEFYGRQTLEEINRDLSEYARAEGVEVEFFQSNHEGSLVDRIQQAYGEVDMIIINPGAFTHYSVALYDALKTLKVPVLEVHLSNIYAREEFRHHSLISPLAVGGVFGLGPIGYRLALEAACQQLKQGSDPGSGWRE